MCPVLKSLKSKRDTMVWDSKLTEECLLWEKISLGSRIITVSTCRPEMVYFAKGCCEWDWMSWDNLPHKSRHICISRKDLLVQIYCDWCLMRKASYTWKQTNQCPQPSGYSGDGHWKQTDPAQARKELYHQSRCVLNTVDLILTCNFLRGFKRMPRIAQLHIP